VLYPVELRALNGPDVAPESTVAVAAWPPPTSGGRGRGI
jgi:hypothetical protein